MGLPPGTPSQTVGPFFAIGLDDFAEVVPPGASDAIRVFGRVFDGAGQPVDDALVEIWQADPAGRYSDSTDGFRGFARCGTKADGSFEFVTVKPGRVPGPDGRLQAPHIAVSVFARGVLKRLVTRVYFPDETAANAEDPVLASLPDEQSRAGLVAGAEGDGLRFDIRLQGGGETAFFAL